MPGGSDYAGPAEALEQYKAVVDASGVAADVKGAKNPYTSRNGHMFSFLDDDGQMALRFSDEMGDEFRTKYESGEVRSYGAVMRGYSSVPDDLFERTAELAEWFSRSHEWIGTLKPKPTKK